MKKSFAAVVLVFLSACGGGGGSAPPAPPPPPPDPSAIELFTASIQGLTLDNFFFESFKGLMTRSPESVVILTLEGTFPIPVNNVDNLSDSYRRDTLQMQQIALDMLRTYDRATLSDDNKLNYDIYEWYLQDQVDGLPFINHSFPATYSGFGIPRQTERFFRDLHPVVTAADVQSYVNRLTAVDNKFQQLEDWLLLQRDAGIVEPALTMQVAINQVTALLQVPVSDHPYFAEFREKLTNVTELSVAERANYRDIALNSVIGNVVPAYQSLLGTLQTLQGQAPAAIGVGQFPNGPAYYGYILRHHTTTNLTAAEIHQLGLDELVRIHAEMRVIFDQLGYPPYISADPAGETLQQLYARVELDGGTVLAADSFTTFENLVAFAEANLPQAFDIFPVADVIVLPDPFGGFYIAPSFDGSRPGAFYAGTDFDQPFATMPTLTFHESLPGHHTQIAIGAEANVPVFRKIVRSTVFTEGWALYAERLAFELGWYDNGANGGVFGDLGRLQFEALRAARLVMDTGIHSMGWTFDQATQFNEDNVGASLSASQGAAARYSVIPGQATAYMIGMLQILSERQRAMDALGPNFDLIAFHRALLTNGAVPLALLTTVVDRYIADNTP